MLRYRHGTTLAHRLDPRTKLVIQVVFAMAAVVHTTPQGLFLLTGVTMGILIAGRTPVLETLYGYRFVIFLLAFAPIVEGVNIFGAGFDMDGGVGTALASYRVLLILLVGAVYIQTTSLRESRAAIQWFVPGRSGQVLGMGVSFVGRFFPMLIADLERHRTAMHSRLGTVRPRRERMQILALGGVNRALRRADRFGDALKTRCFSWNPTLPPLRFGLVDLLGGVLAGGLVMFTIVGL